MLTTLNQRPLEDEPPLEPPLEAPLDAPLEAPLEAPLPFILERENPEISSVDSFVFCLVFRLAPPNPNFVFLKSRFELLPSRDCSLELDGLEA
jgi:hypothetical protein